VSARLSYDPKRSEWQYLYRFKQNVSFCSGFLGVKLQDGKALYTRNSLYMILRKPIAWVELHISFIF
jgi:hypothetical protein